jgi:type I restriction enzyme S subunit
MSRIDDLIAQHCPDGVEYKELAKVAQIKRGTSITKKNVIEGDIPVIAGGRTPAYYHNVSNRIGETIVIAGSGAYAGFVSWWDKPIFVSDAFTVKPDSELLAKFCFYWLQNMQQQLHELKSGGGVPHVYPRNVSPLRIPLPPLPVQQEIVAILDKFTKLEAELEAELKARQKQYCYYRNKLLTFQKVNHD